MLTLPRSRRALMADSSCRSASVQKEVLFMLEEFAEQTLRAIIGWARYAEAFAYDEDAGVFSMENPGTRGRAGIASSDDQPRVRRLAAPPARRLIPGHLVPIGIDPATGETPHRDAAANVFNMGRNRPKIPFIFLIFCLRRNHRFDRDGSCATSLGPSRHCCFCRQVS
jgi:hypothetical protein